MKLPAERSRLNMSLLRKYRFANRLMESRMDRTGWVVNLESREYQIEGHPEWFKPSKDDLTKLHLDFSNCAIAEACNVTDTTVRKWMKAYGITRTDQRIGSGARLTKKEINHLHKQARRYKHVAAKRSKDRLTEPHVGRVISKIGEEANVVVQQADKASGPDYSLAAVR